jgi:hypothetical protein
MAGETLKITGGNAAGQDINLEQELVIGRSTPGLGSLGGDSEISRSHARVFHDPSGRLVVEDLGSTNGTFVNGNRITGQQALNPGDELRVGQTTMSVQGGAPGATTVGNVVPAPVPAPAPPAPVASEPPTQALPPQPAPPYGGGPVGGPPPATGGGGPSRNLLIALGIGAAVIVAVVVILLVSGGSDNKSNNTAQTTSTPAATPTSPTVAMPTPPTTDTTPSQSSPGGYSSTFKNSFVSSCAKSGSLSRSQCQCIINKAEAQYSLPDFISAVGKAQKGTTPPKLRQIFVSCANA